MKRLLLIPLMMFSALFFLDDQTQALSMKVAPLEYRATLKEGEKQKGFIDVSNPTGQTVIVKTSVEGFTQTDDKGSLEFSKNEQLAAGVLLDLDEFSLGPREAVRMYFVIDGTKLPTGDGYGAIFFTSTPPGQATVGTGQSVRLGTLLSIVNGTPGSRKAEVVSLETPSFVLGNKLDGTYRIKNIGDPKTSTGFYPNVRVKVWPFGETQVKNGPLVFAGRTRENSFNLNTPWLGVYQISATHGNSSQSNWVLVAHPIALVAVAGLGIALFAGNRYRKIRKRNRMNRQR